MGCCQSNQIDKVTSGGGHRSMYRDDPMSNAEIESRIESIAETRTAVFGGVKVRYAYLTQRGYYPDEPNKANQDAYSVTHEFCNQPADAFFAIYDGHGRDGDRCAHFARDNLPSAVEKFVMRARSREQKLHHVRANGNANSVETSQSTLELTKDQIQNACSKAHIECNRSMHRSHDLDDSLSGTTAISVYVHGRRNRVTICNVGDSRAILGQRVKAQDAIHKETGLRALPLSRDQTPYRRDERARVKATGARVLSLDQIEGLEPISEDDDENDEGDLELGEELDEGGDPPRVWSPHGEYPGTAFTRSLGDAIAEELGVFAEPEMLTRELTPDDKIIVLASDGVFEFLTNQSVIDMCAKFSDPLEACRAVVAESYELWLQYELRTDDITMICIFIDGIDYSMADTFASSSARFSLGADESVHKSMTVNGSEEMIRDDSVDALVTTEGLPPVRLYLSKEKSKAIQQMKIKMASETDMGDTIDDFDLSKLYTEKTEEEKSRIAEAIRASVMFQNITEDQREMIFGVMEPIAVKKGTWIIKQGTVGDRFYIVDTGRFEVRIVPEGEEDPEGTGGNVVHIYEGSHDKHAHPSFGELALMYSAPRAASIIAQTDGHLWALHRYAFRQVLAQQSGRKELINTLRQIDTLQKLKMDEIKNLAAAMEEVTFGRGESIITQGHVGDILYVILSGSCEYLERDGDETVNATLKSGDYFGDEVLVDERRYGATVVALQTTCCWKLDKATLKQTVGSLKVKRSTSSNVA